MSSSLIPDQPDNINDKDYVSKQNESVPVQSDDAGIEDPIDAASADSDEQLARDDKEAIDKSNIIEERTRGASKPGQFTEPSDKELEEVLDQ